MDFEDQAFDTFVCPFCPMHCDDLHLSGEGTGFSTKCDQAQRELTSAVPPFAARMGGDSSESILFQQVADAAALPACPVIQVGNVSIEEAKLLHDLTTQGKIALSMKASPTSNAIAETFARDGGFTATMGDIRQHADFVWVIGSTENTSRLPEVLGLEEKQASGSTVLATPLLEIHSLQQMLGEADVKESDSLSEVTRHFRSSLYTAIMIGEEAFEAGKELVSAELLFRLIQRWADFPIVPEETQRVHRVVLTHLDERQNLSAVFRWRENRSLSSSTPANIRIGSPSRTDGVQVDLQIGGMDPGVAGAKAYFPCSTTGIHRKGTTLRGDGSVTLPLSEIITTDHAHWTDLLIALLDRP